MRLFQSTRPARGATRVETDKLSTYERFNPRAPRGARPMAAEQLLADTVSIHAPRAGRDQTARFQEAVTVVSIHAPRAGRDVPSAIDRVKRAAFQSTRPARGATLQDPEWMPLEV